MRYLAIDLGDRRTGFATGDDVTGVALPGRVVELPPDERLVEAIVRAINEHQPDALVVGLPLNMDGTEGPRAKTTRAFVARLLARVELGVHFQDERLTSYAAEQHLARSGRTHRQKKKVRDALAAAEILNDFLQRS